jgi:hypothetical protein
MRTKPMAHRTHKAPAGHCPTACDRCGRAFDVDVRKDAVTGVVSIGRHFYLIPVQSGRSHFL